MKNAHRRDAAPVPSPHGRGINSSARRLGHSRFLNVSRLNCTYLVTCNRGVRVPIEYRSILFSDEEAVEGLSAIIKLRAERPPDHGDKTLIHSRDGKGDPVSVLAFTNAKNGAEFQFNSREVMAALVNYCIQQEIKLPRDGEKKVDIIDQQLLLRVRIGADNEAQSGQSDTPEDDEDTAAA